MRACLYGGGRPQSGEVTRLVLVEKLPSQLHGFKGDMWLGQCYVMATLTHYNDDSHANNGDSLDSTNHSDCDSVDRDRRVFAFINYGVCS